MLNICHKQMQILTLLLLVLLELLLLLCECEAQLLPEWRLFNFDTLCKDMQPKQQQRGNRMLHVGLMSKLT